MRALVLLLLLLPALPAASAQEAETLLLEDPEGDAFEAGSQLVIADCPVECPIPEVGVPAPPAMDLVAVRVRETPDYLVVIIEVAALEEDLAGLVTDDARGRGAALIVCWDRLGSCNEGVRLIARRQEGQTFLGATYGYRDERCNSLVVCGWGIPFELEYGAPGRVSLLVPRALAPAPLDQAISMGGLQAGISRLTTSPATISPDNAPVLLSSETATSVDVARPVEGATLRTPRGGSLPAIPAQPGFGPGLLVGGEAEADILDLTVVETPATITFSNRFAAVSDSPIDQRIRIEWALQGGRYHLVEITAAQRQRTMTSVACNPSETLGCQDEEDVPATFEVIPGAPGWINVTYLRTDLGAPSAGAQSARLISFIESSAAHAAGAMTDYDTSGLTPPFVLRLATRVDEVPPGAFRVDDSPSDARLPGIEDAPDASAFEVTYVEAQALADGGARLTLGIRDPSRFALPLGYSAAVRAVAIEEEGRTTLLGAYRDEEREAFFCTADTLVLSATRTLPPEGSWRTVPATIGVSGASGNITFLVPPECLAPVDAGEARRATRLAGGAYLVRSSAAGANEVVLVDEAIGIEAFELTLGTAGSVIAPASDGKLLWLALGVVALALTGGGIAAALLMRRAPVAPALPAPGVLFLGKYLVDREIGRGGFGAVWLATHTRLDRKVVIKQLQPGWASDPGAVERFRREARVLAKLDHPNIVKVYDAEEVAGLAFLVMEYVEGGTLGDLRPKPASVAMCGRIGAELLDALDAIHAAGIVHGDLKPDNVLVAADRTVRVADFGIARPTESAGPMRTIGYGAQGPLGTPLFMAPEQLEGEPAAVASDLYAAAAVVHHVATGRLLFTPAPIDIASARAAHQRGAPDAGEDVLHPALAAWLRRGLARDPRDRFASALEMRDALAAAVAVAKGA